MWKSGIGDERIVAVFKKTVLKKVEKYLYIGWKTSRAVLMTKSTIKYQAGQFSPPS